MAVTKQMRDGFQPDEEPLRDDRREQIEDRRPQPQENDDRSGPVIDMVTGEEIVVDKDTWPVRIKLLHKPISNSKGEDISELSFREPTAGDIRRYGMPIRINMDGDVILEDQKMMLMMAALSGVLAPLLDRMDPRDWASCAYRLRGFFIPDFRAW